MLVKGKSGAETGLAAGLIAYWKLDETSGTTATDSKGSNDGVNTNALVNQTGQIGASYNFRQAGNPRVNVPTSSGDFDFSDGSGDLPFSISFWAVIDTFGSGNWLINARDSPSAWDWQFYYLSNSLNFQISDGSGNSIKTTRIGNISSPSTLQCMTITYDGSSLASGLNMYRAGVLETTTDATVGTYVKMSNLSNTIRIGARGWEVSPTGQPVRMDDIKIWGRELSALEVTENYDNGVAGTPLI